MNAKNIIKRFIVEKKLEWISILVCVCCYVCISKITRHSIHYTEIRVTSIILLFVVQQIYLYFQGKYRAGK